MAQAHSNADAATAPAEVASSASPGCGHSLFKPQCLPAGLDGEALASFERAISRQAHPVRAGQAVVRQGDPVSALYAMRVGALKATVLTDDGSEHVSMSEERRVFCVALTWARDELLVTDANTCLDLGEHQCARTAAPFVQDPGQTRALVRVPDHNGHDSAAMADTLIDNWFVSGIRAGAGR